MAERLPIVLPEQTPKGPRAGPEQSGVWMTYAELGQRLGITPDAARIKVKREAWQTTTGNDRRRTKRVLVPADVLAVYPEPSPNMSQTRVSRQPVGALRRHGERDAPIAEWKETIARYQGVEAELRARLADRDAEVQFLRQQLHVRDQQLRARDDQVERMQVLLQTEQQQVKALTDQHQQPPWWRRWFQR